LNAIANEGYLDKIVLLRGYKNLALELQDLGLPELEIDGLFMTQKLFSNANQKISTPPTHAVQLQDIERVRNHYNWTPSNDEYILLETQAGRRLLETSVVGTPSNVVMIMLIPLVSRCTNVGTSPFLCLLFAHPQS
jgi:hypothetical protein